MLWTLQDVTYRDGGRLIGSFVFDDVTTTFSDVAIQSPLHDASFDTSEVAIGSRRVDASELTLIDNFGLPDLTHQRLLVLFFEPALTGAGGITPLSGFTSVCASDSCNLASPPYVFSGDIVGSPVTAVPEPTSLLLLLSGVFGATAVRRRRWANS